MFSIFSNQLGVQLLEQMPDEMCTYVPRPSTPSTPAHSKELRGMPWRRGLVVSSPPATEEIGAMGREIESRQGGSF
jgi:hypothetical protein